MSMVSVTDPPSRAIQGSGSDRFLNMLAAYDFSEKENCLIGLVPISDLLSALLRTTGLC